jgi:hypothetical protein
MTLSVGHNCLNLRGWEIELLGYLADSQTVVEVVDNSVGRHTSSAQNRNST